jgi:GntR family transcriptional regulator of arabinose operon
MSTIQRKNLYEEIKENLIREIRSGKLLPGSKVPTESQLMKQYQVSRITVSKAMSELKEEGYIVRYPSKGSFVSENLPPAEKNLPDPNADSFVNHQYTEIGVVIPAVMDQFGLDILAGINKALPKDQYRVYIYPSSDAQIEEYVLRRCQSSSLSGIIMFPVDQEYYSEQVLKMKVTHYPFVLIDRILPGIDTNYVISDNFTAGRIIGKHLAELGHRNLAIFSMTDRTTSTIKDRIDGLQYELSLRSGDRHFIEITEWLDVTIPIGSYLPTFRKLIKERQITAIVAMESKTGTYLYTLLKLMNIPIPSEMSLLLFDNPINDPIYFDFFTHIDQHASEIGRQAAITLKNILERKQTVISRKILTPTLEIRNSTGPAFR